MIETPARAIKSEDDYKKVMEEILKHHGKYNQFPKYQVLADAVKMNYSKARRLVKQMMAEGFIEKVESYKLFPEKLGMGLRGGQEE